MKIVGVFDVHINLCLIWSIYFITVSYFISLFFKSLNANELDKSGPMCSVFCVEIT